MTEQTAHELGLSKHRVKSIIKDETGGLVTGDAVRQMMSEEEWRMREVADGAMEVAKVAGRKTIQEDDVRVAYKLMRKNL